MMETTTVLIPNPVVVLREEFDDWAILFNPDSANAVGINPIGVVIWKQLDGKRSVSEIIQIIQKQYDQVPETVVEEINGFLDGLLKNGFVGIEVFA